MIDKCTRVTFSLNYYELESNSIYTEHVLYIVLIDCDFLRIFRTKLSDEGLKIIGTF